jgi:ligand-binding SRPBCC domain-containing protein
MKTYRLERYQVIPRPVSETFAFFAEAGSLEAITPPWLESRILSPQPVVMRTGTHIDFRLRWRGVPLRWETRIEEWAENARFVDVQVRGPYRLWRHLHTFEAVPGGTAVYDRVTYALPFGLLGAAAHALIVRADLERIFDFRTERVRSLLPSPACR